MSDMTLSDVADGELSDKQSSSQDSLMLRCSGGGDEEDIPEWMRGGEETGDASVDETSPIVPIVRTVEEPREVQNLQYALNELTTEHQALQADYSKLEGVFFTLSSEKATWASNRHKLQGSISALEETLSQRDKAAKDRSSAFEAILKEHYSTIAEKNELLAENATLRSEVEQLRAAMDEAYAIADDLQGTARRARRKVK